MAAISSSSSLVNSTFIIKNNFNDVISYSAKVVRKFVLRKFFSMKIRTKDVFFENPPGASQLPGERGC